MSDIVLLHVGADQPSADRVAHLIGERVRFVCRVQAGAIGAFGPQFRLFAIWSEQAARSGVDDVYAAMSDSSDHPLTLIQLDGAPLTATLDTLEADVISSPGMLAQHLRGLPPFAGAEDQAEAAPPAASRVASVAATSMLSIAGGALLAGLSPAYVSNAMSAFAENTPGAILNAASLTDSAAQTAATAGVEPGRAQERSDAVLAAARQAAGAQQAQARFALIQRVRASETALTAIAAEGRAETPILNRGAAAPLGQVAAAASDIPLAADEDAPFEVADLQTLVELADVDWRDDEG